MAKLDISTIKIEPITNEEQFANASAIIDELIDADLIQDEVERQKALDILEAITILASEYEKKHYPIPKPDPIEAIKERIEQLQLTQKEVAPYFGGENRVSEVLNKKRNLTLKMIKQIHKHLGIPAEILLAY
ncbi:helix-turn-helix domain-containing protein [Runella limosa]|uniref:helix-turn-helix domain-containing protein n=1 Tax=Runella limosa TaxID=370978 RepID=UPI000422131A|nr:helix-turn-helix domain-containing protein [Runella limosa]MCA0233309.1 helix-turn-helix domain-containing protein [Bacteroidota bacterium]